MPIGSTTSMESFRVELLAMIESYDEDGSLGSVPSPEPARRLIFEPLPASGGSIHPMTDPIHNLRSLIRDIPDFPKPGIVFKDITPLLADPAGLAMAVEVMANPFRHDRVDLVVGAESRGFIFGTAIAQSLSCGFVPIRKPGKLPGKTAKATYDLEYGSDALEVHIDAIKPGQRVLMVDDLLATGGTMCACIDLVRGLGADIAATAFLIELTFLEGRQKLGDVPIHAAIKY